MYLLNISNFTIYVYNSDSMRIKGKNGNKEICLESLDSTLRPGFPLFPSSSDGLTLDDGSVSKAVRNVRVYTKVE